MAGPARPPPHDNPNTHRVSLDESHPIFSTDLWQARRSMSHYTITFNEYEPPDVCDVTVGLRYWRCEYWEWDVYPLGTAWVIDRGEGDGIYLDYIAVPTPLQRHGIGRALMLAILDRWPTVIGTAVTAEGRALCKSLNVASRGGGDTFLANVAEDGCPTDPPQPVRTTIVELVKATRRNAD